MVRVCQFNSEETPKITMKSFPDDVKSEGSNYLLPVAETNVKLLLYNKTKSLLYTCTCTC